MADQEPPKYTKYRARPSLLSRLRGTKDPTIGEPAAPKGAGVGDRRRGAARITWQRVLKWFAVAVAAWIGVSLLLFLVSAQIEQGKISGATETALDPGPFPATGGAP